MNVVIVPLRNSEWKFEVRVNDVALARFKSEPDAEVYRDLVLAKSETWDRNKVNLD